jgi:transcriptional regulator with XRE-family HTH domain
MASEIEMGNQELSSYAGPMPLELGKRLRQAREAAGLSQRAAAKVLGTVTHGAVSQWESSGQISTDNLLRAAAAYRADPMWVMTGQGRIPGERHQQQCDRDTMTDAITAVLTVLQELGRQPPPAVTARIINLIYNRHAESGTSVPLTAERVRDIVGGVVEYLNNAVSNGGDGPPRMGVIDKQRRNDKS